jgi:hypothetical protein
VRFLLRFKIFLMMSRSGWARLAHADAGSVPRADAQGCRIGGQGFVPSDGSAFADARSRRQDRPSRRRRGLLQRFQAAS